MADLWQILWEHRPEGDEGVVEEPDARIIKSTVDGHSRPQPVWAWQIGQGLAYLRRPSWSGISMLYAAGWYGDCAGVCISFARRCGSDALSLGGLIRYVDALPYLFRSKLVEERALATAELESGNAFEAALVTSELESEAIRRRTNERHTFDLEELNGAWENWMRGGSPNSRLIVRSAALSSRHVSIERREREFLEYVRPLLAKPADIWAEMAGSDY